ncbi:MAG: tripartite tricarboxylate transporter TctB family protein [Bacillota bacterium]
MKDRDFVAGVALIISSLSGLVYSLSIPHMANTGLSAGFYPSLLFIILGLCGIALLIQGIRRSAKVPLPRFNWKKFIPMCVLMLVYAYLFEYFGFQISTLFFLITAMIFMGLRKPLPLAGVSITGTFGIYFLFVYVFKITL